MLLSRFSLLDPGLKLLETGSIGCLKSSVQSNHLLQATAYLPRDGHVILDENTVNEIEYFVIVPFKQNIHTKKKFLNSFLTIAANIGHQ